MDIQEEKRNYLAMLVAEDAITQEQCSNLCLYNGGNYFHSDFLASSRVDCINWGWSAWLKSKAQAVPQWISVNDQLPPSDEMVLICWSDSPDIEPEKDFMDICVDTGCPFWANSLNDEPSHWMPLPKPQESAND